MVEKECKTSTIWRRHWWGSRSIRRFRN